jgi:ATP-dependent RNA helicase RhlE
MRIVRFNEFALSPAILQAVEERDHTIPTPIQEQVIPAVLDGRDVLGIAATGSGKTAAYVLPLLDRMAAHSGVHTLVVVPTRELAYQVEEEVLSYGRYLGVRAVVIVGGAASAKQISQLRGGAQVVIGTPGRLLDLNQRGVLDLYQVKALVLDEVDRMLDLGFLPDMQRIVSKLPGHRQSLFFSATMPAAIAPLAAHLLEQPVEVTVGKPATTVPTVTQSVQVIMDGRKIDALEELLREPAAQRVLIFGKTKRDVDDIHSQLRRRGFRVEILHGDRAMDQRLSALDKFKTGETPVMVATDLAARGLDVPDVTHVVNYDVPQSLEDYIHRVGRTARASKDGEAITLVGPEELLVMRRLEAALRQSLQRRWVNNVPAPVPAAATTTAPTALPGERISGGIPGLAPERISGGQGGRPAERISEGNGGGGKRRPARSGSRRW